MTRPINEEQEFLMALHYAKEWECDQHNLDEMKSMDKLHLIDLDGKKVKGKAGVVSEMNKLEKRYKKAYDSAVKWWNKQQSTKKSWERFNTAATDKQWLLKYKEDDEES